MALESRDDPPSWPRKIMVLVDEATYAPTPRDQAIINLTTKNARKLFNASKERGNKKAEKWESFDVIIFPNTLYDGKDIISMNKQLEEMRVQKQQEKERVAEEKGK